MHRIAAQAITVPRLQRRLHAGSSDPRMRTATVSSLSERPVSERLLELAQECFSGALQFDYLSNGRGNRQSTPLKALRAAVPVRASPATRGPDIVRRYLCEIAARKRLSSAEEYSL